MGQIIVKIFFYFFKAPKKIFFDDNGDITNFNLQDPIFESHLKDKTHENNNFINHFLIGLSTCHTVITETNTKNKIIYQSSSPDETALINCARYFKFIFKGRDIHNNIFLEINGIPQTYQLLNLLEYSSDRQKKHFYFIYLNSTQKENVCYP